MIQNRTLTLKKTRKDRSGFSPPRTLNISKELLISRLTVLMVGSRAMSKLITFLNSPPGFDLKAEVIAHTIFLNKTKILLKERIYCLINDINITTVCEACSSTNVTFVDSRLGYRRFCSASCSAQSEKTKGVRAVTNIEKYGSAVAFRNVDIKKKQQETLIKRYGVTNSWHLADTKKSVSAISQELFWNSWHNSRQEGECFFGERTGELRVIIDGQLIKPDCAIINGTSKRIIEFYGDYWHADSEERDNQRQKLLEKDGWEILIVWENRYMKDKISMIELCTAFIDGDLV